MPKGPSTRKFLPPSPIPARLCFLTSALGGSDSALHPPPLDPLAQPCAGISRRAKPRAMRSLDATPARRLVPILLCSGRLASTTLQTGDHAATAATIAPAASRRAILIRRRAFLAPLLGMVHREITSRHRAVVLSLVRQAPLLGSCKARKWRALGTTELAGKRAHPAEPLSTARSHFRWRTGRPSGGGRSIGSATLSPTTTLRRRPGIPQGFWGCPRATAGRRRKFPALALRTSSASPTTLASPSSGPASAKRLSSGRTTWARSSSTARLPPTSP